MAVPVLTSFVYREAELKNSSDEDLLAGPITVYLDGRFVGQGEIPTVARGQTFVVGFGADPQLRARRELVDKKDGVQGGNRETRFEYRLVVENFSGERDAGARARPPAARRERRRHPVTLGKTSDPISDDKLYQREERPMGLLRWDVEVPANAAGEDARLIEYQYAVEYDRQYVVSLPESKQRLQEEFERLQRERQKTSEELEPPAPSPWGMAGSVRQVAIEIALYPRIPSPNPSAKGEGNASNCCITAPHPPRTLRGPRDRRTRAPICASPRARPWAPCRRRGLPSSARRTGTTGRRLADRGSGTSGFGVLRSLPRSFENARKSSVTSMHTRCRPYVVGSGAAAAVAVEAGHRFGRARLQFAAENILGQGHDTRW